MMKAAELLKKIRELDPQVSQRVQNFRKSLPVEEFPEDKCTNCQGKIVISYLIQPTESQVVERGECLDCSSRIPTRLYPLQ